MTLRSKQIFLPARIWRWSTISRKLTWKPKGAPNQWGLEDDVLEFSFSGSKFLFQGCTHEQLIYIYIQLYIYIYSYIYICVYIYIDTHIVRHSDSVGRVPTSAGAWIPGMWSLDGICGHALVPGPGGSSDCPTIQVPQV